MQISTERLLLKPLSAEELRWYISAGAVLEQKLGLRSGERLRSKRVDRKIESVILPEIAKNKALYVFHTFWLVIDRQEYLIVGEIGFKGPPNRDRELNMGYATYPAYRQRGYMTEAITALLHWASQQAAVMAISADTDPDNLASIKILQKNNFRIRHQDETTIQWVYRLRD